jgi:hypothetical protein
MIVDDPDQLIDEKSLAICMFMPGAGLFDEPAPQDITPSCQRVPQGGNNIRPARRRALIRNDIGNSDGKRPAIDDFSLFGDTR